MSHKRRYWIPLIGLLGILVSAGFSKEYRKTIKKTIPIHSGSSIEVQTLNGNIQVEGWDREEVSLVAELTVNARNDERGQRGLDAIKLEIEKNGNNLFIKANLARSHNNGFWNWIFGSHTSASVSFKLKIPRESKLQAKSTNGAITAENMKGKFRLETTNGKVTGTGLIGMVKARTTNGNIHIVLDDIKSDGDMEFLTTNGSITVAIPRDANCDIHAQTVNGSIKSDFPLTVHGKFVNKSMDGKINNGGTLLYLKTVNGSIRVGKKSGNNSKAVKDFSGFENLLASLADRYHVFLNVSADSAKQILARLFIDFVRKSFLR